MDAADDSQTSSSAPERGGVWSTDEHDKFIEAITKYPNGPWKTIADYVGTRSVRQVQTHAQKYQEKVARRERGLQKNRQKVVRMEHRVDKATYDFVNRPRAAKGRKPGSKKTSTAQEPPSTTPSTPETWTIVENPRDDEAMPSPPAFNMMELLNSLPGSPMDVESPHLFKEPLMSPPKELLLDFDLESPTTNDVTRRFMPSVTLSSASDEAKAPADVKRLRKTPDDPCAPRVQPHEVPTINESLDFFLKLMRVWPHAGHHGGRHY